MEENTQSVTESPTDVSTDTGASLDTTGASALSPEGGTTQPDGTTGAQVAKPNESDDPLAGVPSVEELKKTLDRPDRQALLRLREAYEPLRDKVEKEYKPLEAWKPLAERFTEPALLEQRLNVADKLFAHQMNNGQLVINPQTGLPQPDVSGFLSDVQTQSPATFDALLSGILSLEHEGQTILQHAIKMGGYVPASQAASGVISPQEMQRVDPQFHEAYQRLLPPEREDIQDSLEAIARGDSPYLSESDIRQKLQREQTALKAEKFMENQEQEKQEATQRQQQAFHQETEKLAVQSVDTLRTETFTQFAEHLASQWKPTADESLNAAEYSQVMGNMLSLLDPNFRQLVVPGLEKSGIKVDGQAIDDLLNRIETNQTNSVRYGRYGDSFNANQSKAMADQAKQLLVAKLHTIAMGIAVHRDGQLGNQRQAVNTSLQNAATRPAINGQPYSAPTGLQLPPGIKPFTPEARAYREQQMAGTAG